MGVAIRPDDYPAVALGNREQRHGVGPSALPPGGGQQHRLGLPHLAGKASPIQEPVNSAARANQPAQPS